MARSRLALGLLLLIWGVAFEAPAQDGQGKPKLAVVPQTGAAAESIQRNLARIKLPPGFTITLFALVPHARQIAVGPRGKLVFVGTDETKVYAVTNSADARTVTEFAGATRKNVPNGVCFSKNGILFVVEHDRILAFPDAEETSEAPGVAPKIIVPQGQLKPREEQGTGHGARVCKIGPDGKLYVALGQPFNVPPRDKMPLYSTWGLGGIIRMGPDGMNREVFARGIRNSLGMDFNPRDLSLWFTDNQVDLMGDDIPPGELNRAARAGLDFGFPWYGGGHTRTNEYEKETPPADVVFPEVEMIAHAADLGMTFYAGEQFPQAYRGGIFSAQHGSWNRSVPVGARIMFTSLKPDGTADKTEVFAEGWLKPDRAYWGRPVDVAQLPDGSLLVSDDDAGALYMISYNGR